MEQLEMEKVNPPDKYADGEWVKMGGRRQYLVPALPFRTLREMGDEIAAVRVSGGGLPSREQVGTIIKVIHSAMVINYPDMTVDQLEGLISVGNFMQVFRAVLNIAGLKPTGEPEAASL